MLGENFNVKKFQIVNRRMFIVGIAKAVIFTGILPDLFAENQGVIAVGFLKNKTVFYADEVLAKHDENYMPKELIENLKGRGVYVDPS